MIESTGQLNSEIPLSHAELHTTAIDLIHEFDNRVLTSSILQRSLEIGKEIIWSQEGVTVVFMIDEMNANGWFIAWGNYISKDKTTLGFNLREIDKVNIDGDFITNGSEAGVVLSASEDPGLDNTRIKFKKVVDNLVEDDFNNSQQASSAFRNSIDEFLQFNPTKLKVLPFKPD